MIEIPAAAHPPPPPRPAPAERGDVAFHRLPRTLAHRRYWWRPLVTLVVTGAVYVVMVLQLLMVTVLLALLTGVEPSAELRDPLNPIDQLLVLGMLALLLPAVLVGTLAGHGRAGIAHSVTGRFRWRLLGRAGLVVLPVYAVVNIGMNLALAPEAVAVPPLTPGVVLAWVIALVLGPFQAAAEEYVFRVLPMQTVGTWLRRPLLGILLPIPLFVLGHGYAPLGQVDIALFALLMGLLAWKTGGIEIPVLLHVANNWTLFAIAPLVPGALEQGEVTVTAFLLAAVPTLLCSVGIWWWSSRRERLGPEEPLRGRPAPAMRSDRAASAVQWTGHVPTLRPPLPAARDR